MDLITRFTEKIDKLGPLGCRAGLSPQDLVKKLTAARAAAADVKLRIRFAQLTRDMRQAGDYSPEVLAARMVEKIEPAIKKALAQNDEEDVVFQR